MKRSRPKRPLIIKQMPNRFLYSAGSWAYLLQDRIQPNINDINHTWAYINHLASIESLITTCIGIKWAQKHQYSPLTVVGRWMLVCAWSHFVEGHPCLRF